MGSLDLTVPVTAIDHGLGPAHARITIVEYGDLECPNCKQAAPGLKLLLGRYPTQLRLVWRHFPLEEIHPHALGAALAAEAAAAQGKFWPMQELLLENQLHLKPSNIRSYAERLELDMERFDSDLRDAIYLQRVREHIEGGKASGVRSTPTVFINGVIQDVSFGLQSLSKRIDELEGK